MQHELEKAFITIEGCPVRNDEWWAAVRQVRTLINAQEAALDLLRMQLAACGTAASANTRESAERCKLERDNPYWCFSYQQVVNAVEREMEAREEKETAIALGLGFGFGKACALLDEGKDPRTVEMTGLFEVYRRAVAVTQQ